METLQKALQQFISIVNALSILSYDPDHGSASFWLIQGVQVFTQSGNHTLVPELWHNTTLQSVLLPIWWPDTLSVLLHLSFPVVMLPFPIFSSLTHSTSSQMSLCSCPQMVTFVSLMGLTYLGTFERCPWWQQWPPVPHSWPWFGWGLEVCLHSAPLIAIE